MNSVENLYLIALLPPKEIQEEITLLKKEVARNFDSKHALNAPPHITLHMPFRRKKKRLSELEEVMGEINAEFNSFEIQLDGFNFFEPRVIFINVISNPHLIQLQKRVAQNCRRKLNLDNANYKNQPFQPHITIAFRDLNKQKFFQAKSYYESKEFNLTFLMDKASLLRKDNNSWVVVE